VGERSGEGVSNSSGNVRKGRGTSGEELSHESPEYRDRLATTFDIGMGPNTHPKHLIAMNMFTLVYYDYQLKN